MTSLITFLVVSGKLRQKQQKVQTNKSVLVWSTMAKHLCLSQSGKNILDDFCYVFENIKPRIYNGLKLTTTNTTIITQCNQIKSSSIDWTTCEMTDFEKDEVKSIKSQNPTWSCPELLTAAIEIFQICPNDNCNKKIEISTTEEKRWCPTLQLQIEQEQWRIASDCYRCPF